MGMAPYWEHSWPTRAQPTWGQTKAGGLSLGKWEAPRGGQQSPHMALAWEPGGPLEGSLQVMGGYQLEQMEDQNFRNNKADFSDTMGSFVIMPRLAGLALLG